MVLTFNISSPPVIMGTGLIALDVVVQDGDYTDLHTLAGGTCGNVMAIMSYLGWSAFPVARMNGDAAAKSVRADLSRWGVRLEYAGLAPTGETPVIIQRVRNAVSGGAAHSFSWNCPTCGNGFPRYKPVHASSAKSVAEEIGHPKVFFTDRVSSGSLLLAKACAAKGALVVFEPSGIGEPHLFEEMLRTSHILKYSDDRLGRLSEANSDSFPHLQIATLGAKGLKFRTKADPLYGWQHVDPFEVDDVQDTCGAGDWTTAGLIYTLGVHGAKGLLDASSEQLIDAMVFGQALAGWNCRFVGARGGMYAHDRDSATKYAQCLMRGDPVEESVPVSKIPSTNSMAGICPNCG